MRRRHRPIVRVIVAAVLCAPLLIASVAPAIAGKPTASTSTYLEGIDVSEWQGTIDWAQVVAAGKRFAFIRASAGTLTADATYVANHAAARSAGMTMGAYHFANPDRATDDAIHEADWFIRNASITSGEIIPALDVEVANGLSVSEMKAWVASWLARFESRTGLKAIIYTSPSFWSTYLGDTTQFADAGYKILWIANWRVSTPAVPAQNWGGNGWTFWQYSSKGTVAGISGSVDLDRYKGTSLPSTLLIP